VLFIPGMAPLNNEDIVNPKTKNIRLYVKRVFISDDFDGELVYLQIMHFPCCGCSELLCGLF
jgi:Hsp90 protein